MYIIKDLVIVLKIIHINQARSECSPIGARIRKARLTLRLRSHENFTNFHEKLQ